MNKKIYSGYFIDKSIKDKRFFTTLNITNKKTIWFGLITIYEVKVSEKNIDSFIRTVQQNLVNRIGFYKQEFYAHLYCEDELIVIYREKTFHITSDKSTWDEAISYGRSLGIIEKQLDFLTPDENRKKYFTR